MYIYVRIHTCIWVYIILCTCHISMLYRYVGMCDKHVWSIHMLSMLYKPKNSLVRAHAFCWETHWVTSQFACHSSMPEGQKTFSETTVIICHRPWYTSLALVCGWKAKAPQPTDTWLGHAISQFTSDFSHQSVMGMPWRNKRSDLRHVGRLEPGCGVIWCHKAW